MIVVGLTGGIGSGKSTFAKIVKAMGFPVYNSDDRAKFLMSNSIKIKNRLIEEFGHNVYIDGELNRKYLSSIVFENPNSLQVLNSIVHPVVAEDFDQWIKDQDSEIVFKEAAILFESGAYKQCDINLNIYADLDQRISRVVKRDNVSEQEVLNRINNQFTEQQRMDLADYNIRNNNIDDLFESANLFIEELKEKKTR